MKYKSGTSLRSIAVEYQYITALVNSVQPTTKSAESQIDELYDLYRRKILKKISSMHTEEKLKDESK
jgi:hypothetical protein